MKILFATNSYPPNIGGAEVASKRIVDILSTKHEVTVLTKPTTKKRVLDKEKQIVELKVYGPYSFMPKLGKFLKENEFDVYICFGFAKHFFDKMGKFSKKHGKKSIAIPSGYFHTKKLWIYKKVYEKLILKKSIQNYDCLVNLTKAENEFWINKFKYPKYKSVIIPHTLEENYTKFKPTSILKKHGLKKNKYILYVGRMAKNKRPDILIKAFNKLKTDLKLVVAGKGTDCDELKNLKNSQTLLLGSITEDEKKELIKNCLFFVFPSDFEGYGLVILEALAFNKPILVSDIPVFREIIREKKFCFKNNTDSLKKKLEEFIKKPIKIKNFKYINSKEEYLNLINKVCQRKIKI